MGRRLRLQILGLMLTSLSNALLICVVVCRRKERLDSMRNQLIRWIESKREKTLDDGLLVQSLHRSVTSDTVWHTFELDRSLIAPYFGHLLSFSVLFNQLIPR